MKVNSSNFFSAECFIPLILVFCHSAFALDVSVVLARQQEAAFPDTSEIKMRTTIEMQGLPKQSVDTYILSKGENKSITEIKSPVVNMKIVRNGNKISVKDMKTGMQLPPQAVDNFGSSPSDFAKNLGTAADYNTPVKENSLWRISPKDASKPTLFYSENIKRIVKMTQTVDQNIEAETHINYCKAPCPLPGTPSEIKIYTTQNSNTSMVLLEILSAKRVPPPPDAVFE